MFIDLARRGLLIAYEVTMLYHLHMPLYFVEIY